MAEPDNELDAREADMAATYWDREKKRRASLSRFAEEGATDGTGDRNIDDDAPQGDEEKMRREMIDRLCDMGMDEEAIPDGVSVAFLADIVRMLESKQAEAEQAGEEQGEQQGEAQGKQEQATQDEQGGQPQPVAGEQPGQPEGGEELPWAQEMPEEEQPRREFAEAYKREDDADRNQQNTTAPNDTRRRIELQLKQGDDREANREFNRKQDRESPRRPRQMDMAEPEREYDDLDDDASDEDRRRREEERRKRDDDDMSDDRDDDMIDGEEMAERSMAEEAPGYRGERQPSLTDSNPRRGQRADRTDANGRQYGPSGDMSDEAYEDWQAGERNEYAEGDDLPEIEEEEGIDLGPPIRDVQNPKEREARGREGQRQIQQNNRRADRMTRRFHAGQENGSQAGDINDLHFSEDDDQQANDDAQQEWEQRQPPERRRPYEPDQTDANGRSPGGYRRMPGWQQRPQPEDFDDFAEEAEEAARQNQDTSRESDRALDEFLDASDGPVSTRMAEEEPEPEEWDRDPNECPHGVYRGASDCPICDRPSRVGQNRGESNKQPSRPDEEFAEDDDNEEGGPRRPSNTRRPFDVEPDPTENLPPPMPPSSRRKGGNRGHSVDPPRRHAEGMEETGDEPDEFESGDPVRRTLHWTQQHKGKSSGNAYVSPSQHQGLFTVHEDQTHVPEGHIRIRGQQGERHVVPTQDLEHDHPDNFAEGVEQFADEENGVDNTGARAAEVASRRRARGADRKVVRANQQRGQNQPARPQQPNQGSAPMKLSELAVLIRREVQSAIQGETRKAGQSLHAESTKAINEVRKHSEQIARTEKKRGVDAIIDRLSREGKLPPVLVPSVRQRLMRADTRTHVAKFSEQGKRDVLLTEFDCQVRELERMPTLFSERFSQGDGKGGNKQEAEDAQIAKIEDHFEAFSESFRSVPGSSKEKLVEGYKAARKSRPGITADEFLNL